MGQLFFTLKWTIVVGSLNYEYKLQISMLCLNFSSLRFWFFSIIFKFYLQRNVKIYFFDPKLPGSNFVIRFWVIILNLHAVLQFFQPVDEQIFLLILSNYGRNYSTDIFKRKLYFLGVFKCYLEEICWLNFEILNFHADQKDFERVNFQFFSFSLLFYKRN